MNYTPSVLRAPNRWWWIASALVHASVMGVVTVTPTRSPMETRPLRAAAMPEVQFELDPDPRRTPSAQRAERVDGDAGVRIESDRRVALGGAVNAQNIDSIERGERGDGRSDERGRLLATRAESVHLSVELMNARGVDQVQRIRTDRLRESSQNDRRTPNPGDESYVSLAAGELWFRVARGPTTLPTQGALLSAGAAQREGARPPLERPAGDTTPSRTEVVAGSFARPTAGVMGASGARAAATGLAATARANIEPGRASTTSERLSERTSDDEDAAALATSLARDALNATVHAGREQGQGVGGVGGGGRAGSGGGIGEGGRARSFGEGEGALSLSSPDPRYRRYFLTLRRRLLRLVSGTFPHEAALEQLEGRVMLELRVDTSGALHVLRVTRGSGIAAFDNNVRRALDGAQAPAIPTEVSSTAIRVVFDYLAANPVVL
jgi:TonB family protein